jgi:hypothetical protein
MSASNNNNTLIAASEPSICIPRVFATIDKKRVYEVIAELFGADTIDRIDLIQKEAPNGETYKRVFIHFKRWANTTQAQNVRQKLIDGDEVKIVYDAPWFWKCTASRVAKPEPHTNMPPKDKKPFIVIGDYNANAPRTPVPVPRAPRNYNNKVVPMAPKKPRFVGINNDNTNEQQPSTKRVNRNLMAEMDEE